jgi:hypothetical protein
MALRIPKHFHHRWNLPLFIEPASLTGKDYQLTTVRARLIAFALAVAAAIFSWTMPIVERSSTNAPGATVRELVSLTQIDLGRGSAALAATALAVVVAFLPLVLPRLKRTAAVLLTVFSVLGAMSVGLFYLPAAIAMWLPERQPSTSSR